MMTTRNLVQTLSLLAIAAPVAAQEAPPCLTAHHANAEDFQAIKHVLATYTKSVSSGDEKAFAELLLDEKVPFMGTKSLQNAGVDGQALDTRRYEGFRQSVFASGRKLEQQFYNVHIQQDGALAQVSLDFVTREPATQGGSYGWKTIQLLHVNGKWRIASEFYTAYSIPGKK